MSDHERHHSDDEEVKDSLVGCFPDLRPRTTSFDLHHIGSTKQKMSLIHKLFRSRSDGSLRSPRTSPTGTPKNSPQTSPKNSPGQCGRRRFVRVVKNHESEGEEYENPHVIRKYSRGYIQTQYMTKSSSLEDHDRPLPYVVTGHTILKKHPSMENTGPHSQSIDALNKHASFNEDVEVMPFERKSKCEYIRNQGCILHARLQDDLENLSDSSWSESLTDQEIPESDEDNYQENLEEEEEQLNQCAQNDSKKVTTFTLNNVRGEDASDNEDDSTECSKNCQKDCSESDKHCLKDATNTQCSSPKILKQNSDEGLPAPKKSKFGRAQSLDSSDVRTVDCVCSDKTKLTSTDSKTVEIES